MLIFSLFYLIKHSRNAGNTIIYHFAAHCCVGQSRSLISGFDVATVDHLLLSGIHNFTAVSPN
jgi:hypothetical protein